MLALAIVIGCSEPPTEDPPTALQIDALAIWPLEETVYTGPDGGAPIAFTCEANLVGDRGTATVTELVEWSLSNQGAGSISDGGVFTPSTENGGVTWVTARFDEHETQATITVVYEQTLGDDPGGFDEPDADLPDPWLYPEDGVNLPRNTPAIHFQWQEVEGIEDWRLRFRSAVTDLTIYTDAPEWEANAEDWPAIAATNAGGQVEVELSGREAGGRVLAAPTRTVQVNRLDAEGSIFYWSTSIEGFMEIPYGREAIPFLGSEDTGQCLGCHTIHGDWMAYSYGFETQGGVPENTLGVVDLTDGSDVLSGQTEHWGTFKSWSPDGALLLSVYQGALLLYDGQTLEYLWEVPLDSLVTHVDWAPDGRSVALVMVGPNDFFGDTHFVQGSLAVMDHLVDGQFAEPEVIYRPPDGYNAYYPTWSPDGEWIAFNQSTDDSYDDPDAELLVIRPGFSEEPVALEAANQGPDLTNSWPRWGPLPDDDVLWITFASKRAYGRVAEGIPQIWVAAFDPALAETGQDPSWPAFWLPDQDPEGNNHLPWWVE